jgi:hypothetical protein
VVLRDLVNKWFLGLDHPAAVGYYSAVGGVLFGKSGPSYTDVCQGYLGDCWLIVGFAETAARMPGIISSMFTANGNNTWTVRFYLNGVADYVTVDNRLPGGGTYYDDAAGRPLWVALAEKAFAQENASGQLETTYPGVNGYFALDGGDPLVSLQAITGLSTTDFNVNSTAVGTAWQQGQLVVLSTPLYPASYAIVPDHAYAVVGYNKTTGAVTLFNPWGASGGYEGNYFYPGYASMNSKWLRGSFDQITTSGAEKSAMADGPGGVLVGGSVAVGGLGGLRNEPAEVVRQGDEGRGAFSGSASLESESVDAVFRALAAKQDQGWQPAGDLGTRQQLSEDGARDGEFELRYSGT